MAALLIFVQQTLFIHSGNMCVVISMSLTFRGPKKLLTLTTFLYKYTGNILILRGNIDTQPSTCRTIPPSQLVAERVLESSSDVDVSAAI